MSRASKASLNAFLPPKALPTDMNLSSAIRVDLAGELGAVALYEGQLKGLKDHSQKSKILEMKAHEEEHRALFQKLTPQEGSRPSLLNGLWQFLGHTIGYAAGRMGFDAAMAQTEAVETIIEAHYQEQLDALGPAHPLYAPIYKCQQEEAHHKEEGRALASSSFLLDMWQYATQKGTALAIHIAKRI